MTNTIPRRNDVILVTGATGQVGGQVVRQLHDQYGDRIDIRALVRNPDVATFADGTALPDGVRLVRGDLSDPATLTGPSGGLADGLADVTKIFLVWPSVAADRVAADVIGLFANQVERIVYLSSEGASAQHPADPVNRSHAMLERVIRSGPARWTFLRGGGFARNDLGWVPGVRDGVVTEPFGGWARSVVHETDLAAVGVQALVTDDLVNTATGPLTGPESLTQAERVAILAEVIGRPLDFTETPLEQARAHFEAWLPSAREAEETIAAMQQLTQQPEKVTDEVERIVGRPASTYRQWVLDHLVEFTGGTTSGLAHAYASMIRHGEFDVIRGQLLASDYGRFASDRMDVAPGELVGDEVWQNMQHHGELEEITGVAVDEPFIGIGGELPNGEFAVRFTFDAVDRATGKALHYPKVSIYTVREGRIVYEHVFLDRPAFAR